MQYWCCTIIEILRTALKADRLSGHADFFSFGTKNLPYMSLRLSHDDMRGFLPNHPDQKFLPDEPFQIIDNNGIGELIDFRAQGIRQMKPNLTMINSMSIDGYPKSVKCCNGIRLNDVNCSPFQVGIARLAAAQAAMEALCKPNVKN
jgi:pyruvate,orthophosphate dikinase